MHDIWNPWHGCIKVSEGCANCCMYYLDKTHSDKDGSHIYLMNIGTDKRLYRMLKDEAFAEIYNITFSEDADSDYRFDITPCELSDHDCYVFAVGNGEQVRILAAADLKYIMEESEHELDGINVSEAIITVDELNEIISTLRIY